MLTARPITRTEPTASVTPKPSAAPGSIRPAGIGRLRVRRMIASMSRSYHMLIAPHAPAATAMHSTAVNASTGLQMPGRDQQADQPGEHHQAS